MYSWEMLSFNIHDGFLEAIVRGNRSGLLTQADYNNLCQCETLDDIKMHLSATEYGPYLQNGMPRGSFPSLFFGLDWAAWSALIAIPSMPIEISIGQLEIYFVSDNRGDCTVLGELGLF